MSTRANVILDNGTEESYLYKHRDGYLSSAGFTLFTTIQDHLEKVQFTSRFSMPRIEEIVKELPRAYEDTDSIHGDIEFLYKICYTNYGIQLFYKEIPYSSFEDTIKIITKMKWKRINKDVLVQCIMKDINIIKELDRTEEEKNKEIQEYNTMIAKLEQYNPNF